jgi:hypothetical protein
MRAQTMTVQTLPFIEPEPVLWADESLPARGFVEKASGLTRDEAEAVAERLHRKHPGKQVRRTHRLEGKEQVWRVWVQLNQQVEVNQ